MGVGFDYRSQECPLLPLACENFCTSDQVLVSQKQSPHILGKGGCEERPRLRSIGQGREILRSPRIFGFCFRPKGFASFPITRVYEQEELLPSDQLSERSFRSKCCHYGALDLSSPVNSPVGSQRATMVVVRSWFQKRCTRLTLGVISYAGLMKGEGRPPLGWDPPREQLMCCSHCWYELVEPWLSH